MNSFMHNLFLKLCRNHSILREMQNASSSILDHVAFALDSKAVDDTLRFNDEVSKVGQLVEPFIHERIRLPFKNRLVEECLFRRSKWKDSAYEEMYTELAEQLSDFIIYLSDREVRYNYSNSLAHIVSYVLKKYK